MKKIMISMILTSIAILLLAGCENIDLSKVSDEDLARISEKAIVCNDPYIRYASGCCLDHNDNKICDKDEKKEVKAIFTSVEEAIPEEIVEEGIGPDKFLPSTCTMPSGLVCLDHKADTSGITVVLQNAMGYDIKNINVWISGCGTARGVIALANGAKNTYKTSCSLTAGSQFVSTIDVSYTIVDTDLSHTKTGSISTKVERAETAEEVPGVEPIPAEEVIEELAERCIMPSGLACIGYKTTPTIFTVVIQNGMGYDIKVDSINLLNGGCVVLPNQILYNGEKMTYVLEDCNTGTVGSKFESDIRVVYTILDTLLSHVKIGNVRTKVEGVETAETQWSETQQATIDRFKEECEKGNTEACSKLKTLFGIEKMQP